MKKIALPAVFALAFALALRPYAPTEAPAFPTMALIRATASPTMVHKLFTSRLRTITVPEGSLPALASESVKQHRDRSRRTVRTAL